MKQKVLKKPQRKKHQKYKPKNPVKSAKTPLQERLIITRDEKYNLRPNPNPNTSDSYRL